MEEVGTALATESRRYVPTQTTRIGLTLRHTAKVAAIKGLHPPLLSALLLSAFSGRQRQHHHANGCTFHLLHLLPKTASGKRHDRTNFHATKKSAGNLCRHRRCSALVRRLHQIVAAELLFGFRERAISGQRLAISKAHGLCFGRGLQGVSALDGAGVLLAERLVFLHLAGIETRSKTLFILVDQ